ncbi:hypothetical protein [Pelosinus sp. sgz500959]|uniref:hypothetical protein n=1 Tax=Pelosinus sp. sgz500959 TaxID=3242472 RepID=UPI0036733D75
MINSKKNVIASILLVVVFISLNGCTNNRPSPGNEAPKQATENSVNKETAIMGEFNNMMQKSDVTAEKMIKFLDENIASVSQENASTMIIALEKNQQLRLPKLQDQFADDDSIQKALRKSERGALTDSYINGIQEKVIKDLLLATKNNGFKIETAEGFYYPVIDYSFYKKYRSNVAPDIADYIDIMAVESDTVAVKDAGLKIGWGEILKRASKHERFVKMYGNSTKVEDVKKLLKTYLIFALYGTNNTPLFGYEDKEMVPAAKKAYLESEFNGSDGDFSKIMIEYLTVLKKSDYKLTREVDDYRKQTVENFR